MNCERGGVLGAMDTMYQRGKIQEESLYYEHKKAGSMKLGSVHWLSRNSLDLRLRLLAMEKHGGETCQDASS